MNAGKNLFLILLIIATLIMVCCTREESLPFSFPLAGQHNINETKLIAAYKEFLKVEGALSLLVCRNRVSVAEYYTNYNSYGPEYGYQIWLGSESGHRYYMAMGWGGQFIIIVPDLQLVVTATCWTSGLDWQQAGEHWTGIIQIIFEKILPCVN